MFIKKLHIYGYGKIIDREITFSESFHAVYGENEAGKSTMISFIHSILFGFPLRNQQDNRYEPKQGFKYGGKITLQTEQHGILTIERVGGKAAGEVTLYFEDGTVGGEAEHQALLGGMDRKLFTSIFSFGLKGLQNIQSLTGNELSHYLLSTSILGSDQIIELEKTLHKEMEVLFKPGGKRPEINQELEEITQLAQKVNQKKMQVLDYQSYVWKERKLESELAQLTEELKSLSSMNKKLDLFEQYLPLRSEWMTIEAKMTSIGRQPNVPIDGLNRLEQLSQRLVPLEARVAVLKKKEEELQQQISNLVIQEKMLSGEAEIKSFSHRWSRIEVLQETIRVQHSKLIHLEEKLTSIKKSLGMTLSDHEVERLPLSLSMKNELKTVVADYSILQNKKELLDQQQEQTKEKMELAENRNKQYKDQLLDEKQRELFTNIVKRRVNQQEQEQSVQYKRLAYERVKKQIAIQEKRVKSANLIQWSIIYPLTILMTIIGIWQFVTVHKGTGFFLLLVGGIFGIGGIVMTKWFSNQQVLSLLKKELNEIDMQLQTVSSTDDDQDWLAAEQRLAKDDQIRLLIDKEEMLLQQLDQEYERTIQQFEKWEQSNYTVTAHVQQLKEKLQIPHDYSVHVLLECYEQLELLAKTIEEKQKIVKEQQELEREVRTVHEEYQQLLQRLEIFEDMSVSHLMELVEEEKRKLREKHAIIEKVNELHEECSQQVNEMNYFHDQILQLIHAAEVESEEEYRKQAKRLEDWLEQEERLQKVREHIDILLHHNRELEQELIHDWEDLTIQVENKEQLASRYDMLGKKEKDLLSELAEVKIIIKQLEEEGTYSSLLQQFEMKKALLDDKAKTWAKLAIAKEVLQRTKDYYSMVRLPQVLQRADHIFQLLTNKEYSRIFLHDSQEIMVENKSGIRYSPGELSQATSEQLYLAIRLSLAYYYQTSIRFPIIIDDSFVNFDEERYKRTMNVLQSQFTTRQVIFFTCHKQALPSLNLDTNAVTYLDQQLTSKG
ncbi:ATP-binding protein [Bacillus pinisoli]|uniref:ATP-binding protein n=1 Tax=Bacillus pinisoli TaxID=2901866 RepID=UPI001FF37749